MNDMVKIDYYKVITKKAGALRVIDFGRPLNGSFDIDVLSIGAIVGVALCVIDAGEIVSMSHEFTMYPANRLSGAVLRKAEAGPPSVPVGLGYLITKKEDSHWGDVLSNDDEIEGSVGDIVPPQKKETPLCSDTQNDEQPSLGTPTVVWDGTDWVEVEEEITNDWDAGIWHDDEVKCPVDGIFGRKGTLGRTYNEFKRCGPCGNAYTCKRLTELYEYEERLKCPKLQAEMNEYYNDN